MSNIVNHYLKKSNVGHKKLESVLESMIVAALSPSQLRSLDDVYSLSCEICRKNDVARPSRKTLDEVLQHLVVSGFAREVVGGSIQTMLASLPKQ